MPDSKIVALPTPSPTKRGGTRPGAGRPKGATAKTSKDVRELARKSSTKALRTLRGLLDHEDARIRIAAAQALLDRGHGRAAAQVDVPTDITIRVVA